MSAAVLEFFRTKEPRFADVDDDQLIDFIGEKHPEFLQDAEFKRDYNRIQLGSKLAAEQKEGDRAERLIDRLTSRERMIEPITPHGLLSQPTRAAGLITGQNIPDPDTQIHPTRLEGPEAWKGAVNALGEFGAGLLSPESLVTLPALGAGAVGRLAFAAPMVQQLTEQVPTAAETLRSDAPASQKVESVLAPALTAGMVAALAHTPGSKPSGPTPPPLLTPETAAADNAARAAMRPAAQVKTAEDIGLTRTAEAIKEIEKVPEGTSGSEIIPPIEVKPPELLTEQSTKGEPSAIQVGSPAPLPLEEPPRSSEQVGAQIREQAAPETPQPEAPKVSPTKLQREFNKLVMQYGPEMGWVQDLDALSGGFIAQGHHAGTAAIKAKVRAGKEAAAAKRRAIHELGGDVNNPDYPALITKLKEQVSEAEREFEAMSTGAEAEIPADAPIEFVPPADLKAHEFQIKMAKTKADTKAFVEANLKAAGDSGSVEFQNLSDPQKKIIVSPEPSKPNVWRFTVFDEHGPLRHHEFKSREAAIRAVSGEAHTDMVNGPHYATPREYQVTRVAKPTKIAETPKLGAGEKGTGDLLKTVEEPFKLVGEKGVDIDARAAEKATTEQRAAEAKTLQEKQQLPLIGMGGAIPAEFERGGGTPTAMKYKLIDAERQKRGLEPITKPESVSDQATLDRAMAEIDRDPSLPERLVKELNENPRTIEDWENQVLLLRKIDFRNEYEKAARDAAQAFDDGRLDDMADANARTAEWSNKLTELENASRLSGSARGRALRSLRVMLNEDMTLASLEMRARADRGGAPITDAERAQLQKVADEYKAKSDTLEKHLAAAQEKAAQSEIARVLAEERAKTPQYEPRVLKMAEDFAAYMDKRGAAALTRLKNRLGRTSAGVDPTILADVAEIGAAKLTRGLVDFAKWSDAMAKDIGEWVKPHLKEAWDASQKFFDAELSKRSTQFVGDKEKIRRAVKKMDVAEKIEAAKTSITEKLSKGTPDDIFFDVQKLIRGLVAQGIKEWRPLVNEVHAILKEIKPDWDYRDTMDAVSGHGRFKPLSKDAISATVRDLKGQINEIRKIQEVIAREPVKRTGIEYKVPSDTQRRLIQLYNEVKRKFGVVVTDPQTQLNSTLQARKTYYENRIKDLQHEIDTRQRTVKNKTPSPTDDKLEALKAEYKKLKEEHAQIFPKQGMTDAQRLQTIKTRLEHRIKELQDRIARGDFEPKPRRDIALDAEARKLQADRDQVMLDYERAREKHRWDNMNVFQKARRTAVNTYDAARMLLTTGEFSFLLRQGKFQALAHPIRTARAIPDAIRAMKNEKTARAIELEILNHPDFAKAKTDKLAIEDQHAPLSRQEELIMGRWSHVIPVVSAFNRAARTFLNKVRFDSYLALRNSLSRGGELSAAEGRAIANYVNESTGRGSLGKFEQSAVLLGRLMFSPRYLMSRFQYATGHSMWSGTARSRQAIAMEYGRTLIGLGVYYSLLNLYFGKKASVETDPRSSDFGKIKVGDTRLDPLSGLAQIATFGARTVSGQTKTLKGEIKPLRGEVPFGSANWRDVASQFAWSKAHPVPATLANLFTGKDLAGNITTPSGELLKLGAPITYGDVWQALKAQDIDDATAMALLAFLGEGLQTHQPKQK